MNYRKGILGLSIVLGVLVGGYLGSVYSEFVLGGAVLGGLLGGLAYFLINWAVSRRIHGVLPYDSLDEHHQVNSRVNTQTPGRESEVCRTLSWTRSCAFRPSSNSVR